MANYTFDEQTVTVDVEGDGYVLVGYDFTKPLVNGKNVIKIPSASAYMIEKN